MIIPQNQNLSKVADKKAEVLERIKQKQDKINQMRQDFKIKQTLKKYNVDKLETLNTEQFSDFISKVWDRKNYKEAPNIAKIAKINDELVKSLGLKSSDVFLTKKDLSHFRAIRKANYKQSLSEEEVQEIPSVINNAKSAYFDDKHKNFFMVFEDKQSKEKINFIHFNVDELGNFIITAKKISIVFLKARMVFVYIINR